MAPKPSDRSQPVSPTQLAATSRQKYALAAKRLEGGDPELALLSLHGAVEDGLRAYLAKQGQEEIEGWRDIIERMRADKDMPLDDDIAAHLRRVNALRNRVAHGEHGVIEHPAIVEYQRLAARLLPAYGVPLDKAAPKQQTGARKQPAPSKKSASAQQKRSRATASPEPAAGGFNPLIPVGAVALILLIGLLTTLAQNRPRTTVIDTAAPSAVAPGSLDDGSAPIAATLTAAPLGSSPVPVNPAFVQIVLGSRAVVSAEGDQLSLRAQPGIGGALLAALPAGAEVLVLDGPQQADGLRWWRVRAGANEGWCAEQYLVIQAGP